MMIAQRYAVVINHGETQSAFYIVDTWSPEEEQPDVVASWLEDTSYLIPDGEEA